MISPEEFFRAIKAAPLMIQMAQVISAVRQLDLDHIREEIARSESILARNQTMQRLPAIKRLTEIRLIEEKLLLFFAEQLIEQSATREEVEKLRVQAAKEGALL